MNDKRKRKILSKVKSPYQGIFHQVIKAAFGKKIHSAAFPIYGGYKMFVFYLEGKQRKPEYFGGNITPELLKVFRRDARNHFSNITYLNSARVVIVRRLGGLNKKCAFRDADTVCADIVRTFRR